MDLNSAHFIELLCLRQVIMAVFIHAPLLALR